MLCPPRPLHAQQTMGQQVHNNASDKPNRYHITNLLYRFAPGISLHCRNNCVQGKEKGRNLQNDCILIVSNFRRSTYGINLCL
jgi:hypothetical protein